MSCRAGLQTRLYKRLPIMIVKAHEGRCLKEESVDKYCNL